MKKEKTMKITLSKTYPKNASLEVYRIHDHCFGYVAIAGIDSQLDDEEMEKDISFFETKSKITLLDLKNRGFQSK